MPVHRLMFSEPIEFQSGSIIYPRGIAKLAALKLEMSKEISESLSFYQSTATFVDRETLSQTPTIAFTYSFDWDGLWHGSHKSHMEFIGIFSQIADSKCLNWIRYKFCTIDMPDVLPSRAGQTKKDPGMSAALLYNAFRREGGIIAGDAFNSVLTRGLGLPLNEDDKRLRLLPTAPRSAAGYRLFPAQALDRVRLIRGALAIGFSVRELTTIFAERDRSGTPCRRVLLLAREKLATVEASLRNLQIWRRELKTTLVGWERRLRKTPRGQRAGLLEAFVASHPNRQTRNSSRMPLARGHQKREESQ